MANSISKIHADWVSLLDISGPFVSMPILAEVFPQGVEDVTPELVRSLKADFEFWQERSDDVAVHSAWVRLVLDSLLGYAGDVLQFGQAIPAGLKAEFPEHEEILRPDFVLAEGGKPKLLIQVFPPTQDLGKAVTGSRWAASAGTRMMELLHATETRLGLVTNGEQWMLVDAPRGGTTGFATWYASLWFEERATLNAFFSLLGVRRFFGVDENETLEALMKRSEDHQQEITDQLGLQVRHAVEILIQAVDKAEQNAGMRGGAPIQPDLLYEAALTVMMRLVFLLSAEERKLLPIEDEQYANYYAVSTLREQLQKLAADHGEEVLERRFDAWSRLLAVFRAVHGGIRHQDLILPAYGGSLFDPEKYPFLEGRSAKAKEINREGREEREGKTKNLGALGGLGGSMKEVPLAIDNRTVLHLLDALQLLRVDGEMRRLSFRALDVEQIGHVYEGLLDHKAVRADEVMLGLGGAKRLEPEVRLAALEQERARGEASFAAWLKDVTQRSAAALKRSLEVDIQKDALKLGRLRSACGNDDALLGRVLPFAGLIRDDDFGNPAVILPGSVYVTAGTTRRATGTHYTPRSLTEPIVEHTLEPLVYAGVAEGLPREQWTLRSPAELLDLKVCDMAMGSAGFLVQVVRYLAERVVEAVEGSRLQGEGSEDLQPFNLQLATEEDKLNYARRLVAERCIYGVDKNPLAVEIAKLSLWLVTLAKERPFTFLDHALKCGDALVGTSADDFLRWANRKKTAEMSLDMEVLREELERARGLRKQLESFVALDVRDAERKSALLVEADAAMEHVKRGADLLAGVKLLGLNAQDAEDLQLRMVDLFLAGQLDGVIDADKHPDTANALAAAQKERVFHWEFEFPEVFERGGFNAFVGNPPFMHGRRVSTIYGSNYMYYLSNYHDDVDSSTDLVGYFAIRMFEKVKSNGLLGFIATQGIARGVTRGTSLGWIEKNRGYIYFAYPNTAWQGSAAVRIAVIIIIKDKKPLRAYLDDRVVKGISSFLTEVEGNTILYKPKKLMQNQILCHTGTYVYGEGFVLSKEEKDYFISADSRNKERIKPFLRGMDINSSPSHTNSSWVIDFEDMDEKTARKWTLLFEHLKKTVKPQRDKQTKQVHEASFWKHWDKRPELYSALKNFDECMVHSFTSKYVAFALVPSKQIFATPHIVFPTNDRAFFGVMQSSFHIVWVTEFSSKLKTDIRYTPTDCVQTFPLPKHLVGLEKIGETYYEYRRQIMLTRQEGLTATYNRFHNPEEQSPDIVRLRELHVEMDKAVAAAYGWGNDEGGMMNDELKSEEQNSSLSNHHSALDLGHDFHETAQGVRFTVSESARREILSRLLKLNHERYEEEQKSKAELGMMNDEGKKSKGKRVKKTKSADDGQMGMF